MNSYLQNAAGDFSSSRLLMIITNVVILGVWTFAAYNAIRSGNEIPPIPNEVLTLSGFSIAGKVINSALAEKGLGILNATGGRAASPCSGNPTGSSSTNG